MAGGRVRILKDKRGTTPIVTLIILAISSILAASIGSTVLKLVEETLPKESVPLIVSQTGTSVEVVNTAQTSIDLNSLAIYINDRKASITDENGNNIWEPNEKLRIDLGQLEDVSVVQIIYANQIIYKAIYIKPITAFNDIAFPEINYQKDSSSYSIRVTDDISVIAVNIYAGYKSGEKLAFGFSPISPNDEQKLRECYEEYRRTGNWTCEVKTAEFSLSWVKEDNTTRLTMNYNGNSYTSSSDEPVYFARIEASDITGKLSSIVLAIDSPPSVVLISPAKGAEYVTAGPMNITVEAAASDDFGIVRIELYLDGNLLKTCENTTTCQAVAVNVTHGTHTAMAIAYDNEGQTSSDIANFRIIQDLPPSVSITSPQNGTKIEAGDDFTANFTITAFASDDYGLSLVEVYFDYAKINSYTLNGQREFSLSLNHSTTVGNHTVEVLAYDIGGKNSSARVSFTITPPAYARIMSVYVPEVDWGNYVPTNITQPGGGIR
jgi:hypothetical protein